MEQFNFIKPSRRGESLQEQRQAFGKMLVFMHCGAVVLRSRAMKLPAGDVEDIVDLVFNPTDGPELLAALKLLASVEPAE